MTGASTMTGTRGWSRAKVVALLLSLLSVGVMAAALRVSDDRLDFQVVSGVAEETLSVRGGELSAGNVRVASQLTREGAVLSETTGMFVVVEVRLAATGNRDITLTGPKLLTADGRTYTTYDSSLLKAVSGFRTRNDAVFEVDPAHIDDLTIQLWEGEIVSGYQQRSRIHLGITPGNANQWRAAGRNSGVEPRRTEVTEGNP